MSDASERKPLGNKQVLGLNAAFQVLGSIPAEYSR